MMCNSLLIQLDILFLFTVFVTNAQNQVPQTFNECGGSLELEGEATYGILVTPNFPSQSNPNGAYYSDQDCKWYLDGAPTTLIQFKIWALSIQPGKGGSNITCDFDYLKVSIASAGTRIYCGTHKPEAAFVGMGKFTAHFHSDQSVNYRGFQATFQQRLGYDPCKPNPCNLGTCRFNPAKLKPDCACPKGSSGSYCEIDIKECSSQPCLNGGACIEGKELNKYTCRCAPGWKGVHCEIEKESPCASSPCQNGGTCVVIDIDTAECECMLAYQGDRCEIVTGCGNPGIPYLEEYRRFLYGTKLLYSCTEDYIMSGINKSTCLSSGTWSNEMPTCKLNGTEEGETISPALSVWSKAMIGLCSMFAVQLTVFVVWMTYRSPWAIIERATDFFTKSFTLNKEYDGTDMPRIDSVHTISVYTISDDGSSYYEL